MAIFSRHGPALSTLFTILIGALGAAIAYALSFPAWVLTGPAIATSIAAISGTRLTIANPVRDFALLVLGLAIGAGFDPQAGSAMLRWPLAFAVLAVSLAVTMLLCRFVLSRWFGFDRRSATLASAPGHLSFVMGLAADIESDVARIAVVQSIRLLFLTISVPFIATALGYEFDRIGLSSGASMTVVSLGGLAVAAVLVGLLFRYSGLPAPLMLAAMLVSALGHVAEVTSGGMPDFLLTPALLILGTLIGTRFAGMTRTLFRESLFAGLSTTLIAVSVTTLAAFPVAMTLGMPVAHVLAAFSPGGLETMIALGATMGASPGFVAACHLARLLILLGLIPLILGRRSGP